jgi:hypothetical protein
MPCIVVRYTAENTITTNMADGCMQLMVNAIFQEGWLLFFVRTKYPTNLAFGRKNCDLVRKCPMSDHYFVFDISWS